MNPKIIRKSKDVNGLVIIQPDKFEDNRGFNFEAFNQEVYSKLLEQPVSFSVDSYSRSIKDVIRGLHGDTVNTKLIEVVFGTVLLHVVDMRKDSPTYLGVEEIFLSDMNRWQVFMPPGLVDGHCVLSNECVFHYRLSKGFTAHENQISLKWNDLKLGISWPTMTPILSDRDR